MSNIFETLKEFNTIIAFEESTEDLNNFIKYNPSKTCYLNLTIYPEVKEHFMNEYKIERLPCMISFGYVVYLNDDLENNLLKIAEKEKRFYFDQITTFINENKIFIFIKGTVEEPKCKFTRRLLEIFAELKLVFKKDYNYFNILSDEKMRELCKEFTNWKTYPQIFINHQFYGGLDTLSEGLKDKTIFDLID